MNKHIVTIIVACYNGAKYVERCFECILSQTYKHIEVVFGDDGSTDDSYQLAQTFTERFAEQGMTLKCFTQANVGMVTNRALELATGEYIAVYDVDDILYPESIEKRVAMMAAHPEYGCVRTNGYQRDAAGNKRLFVTDEAEKRNEDIFEDLLFGRTNNWAGSYMVRSEALREVYKGRKVFETRYGANMQVLMPVAYGRKSGFVDEPLMEYMYNAGSITNAVHNYEADRNKYSQFKLIREAVLDLLGIRERYQNELDCVYLKLYLDLALMCNKTSEYLADYKALESIESPDLLYRYHYHRLNGDRLQTVALRVALMARGLVNRFA